MDEDNWMKGGDSSFSGFATGQKVYEYLTENAIGSGYSIRKKMQKGKVDVTVNGKKPSADQIIKAGDKLVLKWNGREHRAEFR